MRYIPIICAITLSLSALTAGAEQTPVPEQSTAATAERPVAKKVLFIGDSMTGWLAERLGAYGKLNGFDVSTIVWDGSTIKKWGNSPKLKSLIAQYDPDAIFVSLGMNNLFEARPDAVVKSDFNKLMEATGDVPVIWVGPPSWPGHNKGEVLCNWLQNHLGQGHFFNSLNQQIPRQSKSNPHPTKQGMIKWMDSVVDWVQREGAVDLQIEKKPAAAQMDRGKVFIYKRMKESL